MLADVIVLIELFSMVFVGHPQHAFFYLKVTVSVLSVCANILCLFFGQICLLSKALQILTYISGWNFLF